MGDINLNRDRWQQVALQRLDDDSDSGYDSDTGQQRPPFRPEWWQKLVDHLYSEVMSDHPGSTAGQETYMVQDDRHWTQIIDLGSLLHQSTSKVNKPIPNERGEK